MKVMELYFTDYYRKYVTIEADALTDVCRNEIEVRDDDCYALCSCFVGMDGLAMFRILSIGSTWENCTRGLENPRVLGVLAMDEVAECEARIAEPDYEMIVKNRPYQEADEQNMDDDIEEARNDRRLDDLRDVCYPDRVAVGIISRQMMYEYPMLVTGIRGPFLIGELDEEPEEEIGVHMDDIIYALPYSANGEQALFALFAGQEMSKTQQEAIDRIVAETAKFGIEYSGAVMKN